MASAQENKQKEFLSFYEGCHARLTRYVQSVVWDKEDVKDIVSETVCRVYEHFESIQKKESLLYYFFKTASRLISKKQKEKSMVSADNGLIYLKPDVNANSAYRSEVADLYFALSRLPEEQREAVVLFEINGFSLNEIAIIQQVSLSGVKSRVTRGREALKKILQAPAEQLAQSG